MSDSSTKSARFVSLSVSTPRPLKSQDLVVEGIELALRATSSYTGTRAACVAGCCGTVLATLIGYVTLMW